MNLHSAAFEREQERQECFQRCIPVAPKLPERKRRFVCNPLEIDASVVKSWIKPVSGYRTGNQFVNLACAAIALEIRRKGKEEIIETYEPFSIDNDKGLSFYWTPLFLALPFGYYQGDILVNGEYCFSINLRFRKCELAAVDCFNEHERACIVPCADTIGAIGCEPDLCTPDDVVGGVAPASDPCATDESDCGAPCGDGAIGSGRIGVGYIGAEDE